jgi:xylan 1,4-beta-xylosidase
MGNTFLLQFRRRLLESWVAAAIFGAAIPGTAVEWRIDFAKTNGVFRPLHGMNKGPLAPGGLLNLSDALQQLSIPSIRLHDCHWPNPDVVDIHAIFPRFENDPDDPASYDFRRTDAYLEAARNVGGEIVFRLGESIEHETVRRYVHPPKDAGRWARICAGIVRHYNEGWANGHQWGIRYWEIWNEPDNRPAMWSGSDEDYFRLYAAASQKLRREFPGIKIGGPGLGNTGAWKDGKLEPSPFLTGFIKFCSENSLPLDFFSWHCYTDNPLELVSRSKNVRSFLDQHGFSRTENHLNEWNYLPDHHWKGLSPSASPIERQSFCDRMAGVEGAAFVVSSLILLQEAPLNVANLFHGEAGCFGLFNENGIPNKVYFAIQAVNQMTGGSIADVTGETTNTVCSAVVHADKSVTILISSRAREDLECSIRTVHLPWKKRTAAELRILDANRDLTPEPVSFVDDQYRFTLRGPAIGLLVLNPELSK